MTVTRSLHRFWRKGGGWLTLVGLAGLTACGKGSVDSIQAQCQQWATDLRQQRYQLLETAQTGPTTLDSMLRPLNQWLISWDNRRQYMAALAVLAKDVDAQNAASQCEATLVKHQRQLFASADLLPGLNQINLHDEPISTQHFVNKLRQSFLQHGANLTPETQDAIENLYQQTADLGNGIATIDLPTWYSLQEQLAAQLGFVDPLLLSRSSQMLPLNGMVREYLQHVASRLDTATAKPPTVDLSFEWSAVQQGLSNLTQTLFAVELIAAELPTPFATDLNRSLEGFEVYENGQLVGELFLGINWHREQTGRDRLDYYPLQRGIAGGQTPRFMIAGDIYLDDESQSLNHRQLIAVLHQFGHFLHHQLASKEPWLLNAGLGTEADFIEAPAKLFEQWAWAPRGLRFFQRQALSDEQEQQLRLAEAHQQSRQWQRREIFNFANAIEQWFVAANSEATSAAPEIKLTLDLAHAHCQQNFAIAYRCLAAMDIADALAREFERFGFDDRQTANKLRREVLAPGGSRPGLDMVTAFSGRSYLLY